MRNNAHVRLLSVAELKSLLSPQKRKSFLSIAWGGGVKMAVKRSSSHRAAIREAAAAGSECPGVMN